MKPLRRFLRLAVAMGVILTAFAGGIWLSARHADAPVASSATAKHARARAESTRANDIASPRRRQARVLLPSPDV